MKKTKSLKAAHDELLRRLEEAVALYRESNDELHLRGEALQAILSFLVDTGASDEALIPIEEWAGHYIDECAKAKGGRKPKTKSSEIWRMTKAAAAVTALKGDGGVGAALDGVCKATRLDKKRLETFRNNLNRGLLSEAARDSYKLELRNWSNVPQTDRQDQILKRLRRVFLGR